MTTLSRVWSLKRQCWVNAGDAEALARKFHEAYERLAPDYGYATREETRQFDPRSPNGRLMIAVCMELLLECDL